MKIDGEIENDHIHIPTVIIDDGEKDQYESKSS